MAREWHQRRLYSSVAESSPSVRRSSNTVYSTLHTLHPLTLSLTLSLYVRPYMRSSVSRQRRHVLVAILLALNKAE